MTESTRNLCTHCKVHELLGEPALGIKQQRTILFFVFAFYIYFHVFLYLCLFLVFNEMYKLINNPEIFFFQSLGSKKSWTQGAYSPQYVTAMDLRLGV
jgi:CDP-diglyceride synthetase